MDYAVTIKEAREGAKLSMRELSERAHVAPSTISRIEAGKVRPTMPTFERLLAACGEELNRAPKNVPSIASLADAWDHAMARPDWTRIRAFLDMLDLHPEYRSAAITGEIASSGSPVLDNLLAGMAETISDEAGFRPPHWTKEIEPLADEWGLPGTARMLESRKADTPPRLANRRLIVDSGSLWRKPARHRQRPAY